MRTISFLEDGFLDDGLYTIRFRLKIADSDDVLQDYSSRVRAADWGEDIDSPGADLRVELLYRANPGEGGGSIAPLSLTGADLPLIYPGRRITLEVGYAVDDETDPSPWHLVFEGEIDTVDPTDPSVMMIEARDHHALDFDRWVETETTYGGGAIEDAMADILDDWGETVGTALYVPTSPGANISQYTQRKQPVLEALQDLAQQIGWDVRWIWHEGDEEFKLTFYNPNRSISTAMHTFTTGDYFEVQRARLTRSDVRNAIRGECGPSNGRLVVNVSDASSISKYRRRWMEILEAEDSPINTLPELTATG